MASFESYGDLLHDQNPKARYLYRVGAEKRHKSVAIPD